MQQSVLHRIFWGFILIGGGLIFLLNQSGIIEVDIGYLFSNYWPVLMIFFGIQGMLLQRRNGFGWNSIVVLMGLFFLGRNLGWLHWELGDLIRFAIPAALIIAGLNMVFRGSGCGKSKKKWEESGWNEVTPPPAPKPFEAPLPPPPPPQPYDSPTAFADDPVPGDSHAAERRSEDPGEGDARGRGWDPTDRLSQRMERRQERMDHFNARMQERVERIHAKHRERHQAKARERHARHGHFDEQAYGGGNETERMWKEYHRPPGHSMRGSRIDHSRFIGDVHIGQEMWELQPMSISHFIGDTTIDLTRAHIPVGETRIYVSAFIGDVKAYVPGDHSVGIRVVSSCLIGDVKVLEQKRGGLFNQMSAETPGFQDTDKQVVLIVSCFIGDVRVTKVG
ncbi:cell wall-active antibiotics response protein LiaF [Cohnella hashimotonis]|uniref:Cell wall-active antibiotics response protein LiaF n=1 Tax=Cohnella hashimotonis TaxID=2826895 RepID=A0ABT6TCW1_9BACL|nr:cell wall-active antibiotics response protein LiaF [Cohnella hashimotonis]MDI4644674.1 cell wall-active antibiotics response protein LiaF [Cohnella hashimotonis]